MKNGLLFSFAFLFVSNLFSQDTIRVFIFDDKHKDVKVYRERLPKKKIVPYQISRSFWKEIHHLEFELIKRPDQGDQIYFWITDISFPYIFKTWHFIDLTFEPNKVIFVWRDSRRKNKYSFVAKWHEKDFRFID